MKKVLFFSFLLSGLGSIAQDKLYKKDNTKLEVKIIEINQTEIKYKLFNYQDGPIIIISKSDVALIEFQNGTHEVISAKTNENISKNNNEEIALKKELEFTNLTSTKNLVSVNVLEPLNGTFGISYLREFANNYANIYIPVAIGYTTPSLNQTFNFSNIFTYGNNITNFRFTRKTIEMGIGVNLQTSGKKAVTHFIGPYLGVAQYNGTYDEIIYSSGTSGNTTQTIEHGFVLNRYYFMLNNGVLFRVNENFNIMLNVAFGVKNSEYVANNPKKYYSNPNGYAYSENPFGLNALKFGVHFGYRF